MMIKKQIFAFIVLNTLSFSIQATKQLSVFEDLLYWHASQQTTSIWAYQFSLNSSPMDPTSQGTYFTEPNTYFGWSPGLRLGIQYTPDNYLDTKLYWTHFSTKTNDSLTAPSGTWLLPQFFNGFTTTNVYNSAELNWNLEMNMMDVKVGHPYNPLDTLIIHPSIGIKGGTINQSLHSKWQMTVLDIPLYNATENLKNNFAGLGPSLSLESIWRLYKSFSILGDLETALLWGHWNIEDDFHRPNPLFYTQKTIQSNTSDSLGTFMAGYFLGFEWSFQAKALVTLRAGYEMQFWSNQLRLPIFQALPIHGDLTLQGGICAIYINLY